MLACSFVVLIAAVPGLVLSQGFAPLGRAAGLAVWIAIYFAICSTATFQDRWRDACFVSAVRAAIVIRCVQSVVPFCWFPDLIIGAIVTGLVGADTCFENGPARIGLVPTLLVVLIHGLLANVLFLLTIVVALPYFRSRQSKKIRAGICIVCGYDLRASPERCPECGTLRSGAPQR